MSEYTQAHEAKSFIAVLPVENLSGTRAPLKEIRELFVSKLKARGFRILDEEMLEKFMTRNRVRYTGGIDKPLAQAFKKETEAEGVLITSLELYSEVSPPKIAITARLVSTGDSAVILWVDGIGLAGDDSPGILELGVINDPKVLLDKAVSKLTGSLREYFDQKSEWTRVGAMKKKFRPKVSYRSDDFDPSQKYTVAVVPFLNMS
ncbi:MAG TPA: hypothetical protein VLZ03_03195, partial [Thermodesulfobacteriota bacterium]|nr:hypothetical protein [Thermodesulfobacteriota bacterium]